MQALQSVAIKREPPRCHAVEQYRTAWQPASLPAVRSTAAFLANARAFRTPSPCERQVLANTKALRTLWRSLKTIGQSRQYGYGNQTSSDQIESATRCVQTAAALIDKGSRDTAVATSRCVN